MNYLLDFDHTLMDTEALKMRAQVEGTDVLVGSPDFWQHHSVMEFLFPDVLPWLHTKPKESLHILTAFKPSQGLAARSFQEAKLASGGFSELVGSVTVMEGQKGSVAVSLAKRFPLNEPIVFIDDRPDQCLSVKEHLPQAHCFLIHRYGVSTHNAPPGVSAVYSLAEVDAIMKPLL
jgi:hypothetical protein